MSEKSCSNPDCSNLVSPEGAWKTITAFRNTKPGVILPFCTKCVNLHKEGQQCCYCESFYSPTSPRQWVGCDTCERWSHLDCVLRANPDNIVKPPPVGNSPSSKVPEFLSCIVCTDPDSPWKSVNRPTVPAGDAAERPSRRSKQNAIDAALARKLQEQETKHAVHVTPATKKEKSTPEKEAKEVKKRAAPLGKGSAGGGAAASPKKKLTKTKVGTASKAGAGAGGKSLTFSNELKAASVPAKGWSRHSGFVVPNQIEFMLMPGVDAPPIKQQENYIVSNSNLTMARIKDLLAKLVRPQCQSSDVKLVCGGVPVVSALTLGQVYQHLWHPVEWGATLGIVYTVNRAP